MPVEAIHQIALLANDLDEAVDFYRNKLGAKLIARFEPPGLAFFDLNGVRLMLERSAPKSTVYFRVNDIDAAYRELAGSGVTFNGEPHLIYRDTEGQFGPAGEEEWMAFFNDPSGNLLAIAARKSTL